MSSFKYAAKNAAPIYESVVNNKGKKIINKILMGTYVTLLEQQGNWYRVTTAGPDGWMHSDNLTDHMGLKIFFLDVGQGDGVLIEIGNYRILIDAGPDNSMYSYLTKWQFKYLLDKNKKIHIDYLIISHFDTDHYKGVIKILEDDRFTFGSLIHPGILKFATKDNPYNTGLGNTIKLSGKTILTHVFDDLLHTNEPQPFNRDISNFMAALLKAHNEGRITASRRYGQGTFILDKTIEGKPFSMEVLAPFMETIPNGKGFMYWKDDGKTINGHSLVIKLRFGNRTVLLGGDLNTLSQEYLISRYGSNNPFEVDVAKSCHHGASDFTEKFMQMVNPYATVISSGDNEGYSHPRADAIGCAGKYSKSKRPLVYSTELARSTDIGSNKILFGMINLRCNGSDIFMSQMKERKNDADLWDAYEIM